MTDNARTPHSLQSLQGKQPGGRTSKKNRRFLLLGILLFVAPPGLLLFLACMAVENQPLVVETVVPTVDSASRVKRVAKAVLNVLNSQLETASISASEDDLNALMTQIRRGARRVSGRVRVQPWLLTVGVSVSLPSNPLGRYLNIRGELLPDRNGLNIASMQIGKLQLPRGLTHALLRGSLNLSLGNGEGTALMNSVQSLDIQDTTVSVTLGSVPQLKERLKHLQAKLSVIRDVTQGGNTPWDNSSVSVYYARLLETDLHPQPATSSSLAVYMGPLFRLARDRSVEGDPVRENSSALLALAIFLGDYRFDKLAGVNLDPGLRGRMPHNRIVQLGGREDLRLHFVISAGLKLLTDQGISAAIGEFKELLDAGNGGSGFSFIDLISDRTGIRFAQIATDSAGNARRLQKLIADHPAEKSFFPVIAGLPENLPKARFEQQYQGVDSKPYHELVMEIDRRIDRCPAYGRNP